MASMPANVLLVDDDALASRSIAGQLRSRGHRVNEAQSVAAAKTLLASRSFDVCVLDYRLPDGTGFDLMPDLDARAVETPIVMLTGHGNVEHAVEAMRRGASTYLQKPVEIVQLEAHIEKAIQTAEIRNENRRLRRVAEAPIAPEAFLGRSAAANVLREQIRRIAESPARAVLLESESGTGKGLVARAIHDASPRAGKPFVAITCSAIPEALLESELFGHESGAFTDARRRKMGLVEAAEGGTLFLDEVGDMAPQLQAKLLGILEDRRYRRIGGVQEIEADVRVISATNKDLRALVKAGRFREDLFYRLRVVPLRIPVLRERLEDVPLLVEHFLAQVSAGCGRRAPRISSDAIAALATRTWPGNVRELRNAVERAVILSRGEELGVADFRDDAPSGVALDDADGGTALPPGGVKIEDLTDSLVRQALDRTRGNQSAAARLVGMSRDQIRYRVQRLGIRRGATP